MGAVMQDINLIRQAGIDPKTGLPLKIASEDICYQNFLKLLRVMDEQDAVNRFGWINQGVELSELEIERMLYYKGDLIFFYWDEMKKFFLMPYTLNGSIDYYGRFNTVTPVPFYEGSDKEDQRRYAEIRTALSQLQLTVVKDVILEEDLDEKMLTNSAVILRDYTNQLGQKNIARQVMMEPLLKYISQLPLFMRTALMRLTGVAGMRVNDQSASSEVMAANKQLENAALTGSFAIPITAPIEMQELGTTNSGNAQEYLMAWQAMDNVRLSFHGLDSGGIFQKKAHMLESEEGMNATGTGGVLQDALSQRINFCDIVNSIWGIGINCYLKESAAGGDMDGDEIMMDDSVPEGNQVDDGGSADAV